MNISNKLYYTIHFDDITTQHNIIQFLNKSVFASQQCFSRDTAIDQNGSLIYHRNTYTIRWYIYSYHHSRVNLVF